MKSFQYSILTDTLNGTADTGKLYIALGESSIIIALDKIKGAGDMLTFNFKANISTNEKFILDGIVAAHDGTQNAKSKVAMLSRDEYTDFDFRDIDYTLAPIHSLYPKRTFVQGELRKVEWYCDSILTDLVLKSEMVYIRDPYGFAVSRTTTRTWYDEFGNAIADNKITEKKYDNNPMEQIKEGKRRRGNIVDSIQLPTLSFMVETMTVAPWSLSVGAILLLGREFMDRHDVEFSKFVGNSSSITDFNDANFGKKTVVVAFEEAASTTDVWLNNTPSALGGATINQYLVEEFTI